MKKYFHILIIFIILFYLNNVYNNIIIPPEPDNEITNDLSLKHVQDKFKSDSEDVVFIMILSGRHNFKQRNDMRKGLKIGKYAKFIIGNRPCRVPTNLRHSSVYYCFGGRPTKEFNQEINLLEKQLESEKREYDDIVEVDIVDVYRSLPQKLKLAYKWGIENIPNAKWFYKTDDDCYINYDLIQSEIVNMDSSDIPTMVSVFRHGKVAREGKWEEHAYKKNRYPPFPSGHGYVVNRPFAQYISDHVDELFNFQGEDVSIAIWAHENVIPAPIMIPANGKLPTNEATCNKDAWSCGHDMTLKNFNNINQRINGGR